MTNTQSSILLLPYNQKLYPIIVIHYQNKEISKTTQFESIETTRFKGIQKKLSLQRWMIHKMQQDPLQDWVSYTKS